MIEFVRKEKQGTFDIFLFKNDGKITKLYIYKRSARSLKELKEWKMTLRRIYFDIPRRKPIFDRPKKMRKHKRTIGRYL